MANERLYREKLEEYKSKDRLRRELDDVKAQLASANKVNEQLREEKEECWTSYKKAIEDLKVTQQGSSKNLDRAISEIKAQLVFANAANREL